MNIKFVGCHPNNFQVGRGGKKIDQVVLHWIVGTLASADATFQNPNRFASATYGIGHTEIHQYVKEENTAFANGNFDSNQRAVSIEHEGGPNLPISEDTYQTSIKLVADICKRNNIPCDRFHIRRHNEVSNTPTQCPGNLDIDRIVREAAKLVNVAPPTPPEDEFYRVMYKGKQLGAFRTNPITRIENLQKFADDIKAVVLGAK